MSIERDEHGGDQTHPRTSPESSMQIDENDDRSAREKLFKAHNSLRATKWLEWGFKDYSNTPALEKVDV